MARRSARLMSGDVAAAAAAPYVVAPLAAQPLLAAFPPVAAAFAYGSGVFAQAGYTAAGPPPMVDLVFAVDDPAAWHAANIARNRGHYSAVAALGAGAVAALQERSAGVYYNTGVPLPRGAGGAPGQTMKYGVISVAALADDLLHWRSLYVAGRLHKPVRVLACERPALGAAARANLRHALTAATLQLPASFTASQLYAVVAGLSYLGDFRMAVGGEHPSKVANIVSAGLPRFGALYAPVLAAAFPHIAAAEGDEPAAAAAGGGAAAAGGAACYTQEVSVETCLALGMSLPLRLQRRMAATLAEEEARPWWRPQPHVVASGLAPSGRSGSHAAGSAVRLAQRGRELLARLRLQRLQWAAARTERREAAAAVALDTAVWDASAPQQAHYAAAAADASVVAFWDAVVARSSGGGGGEVAAAASAYLRPAIAHIVGEHARSQALKGVVSAGPLTALSYGLAKLRKFAGAVLRAR